MRKITAVESVTLDGVMQAPGGADEDTRGGFTHGGWATRYADEVQMKEMSQGFGTTDLLFGRRTYEQFYSFWPHQGDNPFTQVLNASPKYVVSSTLTEPLPWANSTLLDGRAAVEKLKAEPGKDLVVLGSGKLVSSLGDLVDEYVLMIHPLVLGSGRRLFGDSDVPADLRLTNNVVTSTGVIIATYEREGA